MKKYYPPTLKSRITRMQPFAIDIHSGMGDKEQYTNTVELETEPQLPSLGKNIWGD